METAPVSGSSFDNFGTTNVLRERSSSTMKMGFYPRAGFDVGHFTFTAEYNIGPSTKYSTIQTDGSTIITSIMEARRNYFSLKAGVFIGGGRKRD